MWLLPSLRATAACAVAAAAAAAASPGSVLGNSPEGGNAGGAEDRASLDRPR